MKSAANSLSTGYRPRWRYRFTVEFAALLFFLAPIILLEAVPKKKKKKIYWRRRWRQPVLVVTWTFQALIVLFTRRTSLISCLSDLPSHIPLALPQLSPSIPPWLFTLTWTADHRNHCFDSGATNHRNHGIYCIGSNELDSARDRRKRGISTEPNCTWLQVHRLKSVILVHRTRRGNAFPCHAAIPTPTSEWESRFEKVQPERMQ